MLQSIALVRQQVAAVLQVEILMLFPMLNDHDNYQVPPSPGLGDEETHVTELRAAVER